MKAVVVYESHWGNTETIARAIAEGLGDGAAVMTTDEATGPALAGIDLLVAGSPVMAMRLPRESMRKGIESAGVKSHTAADLSHPLLRTWLEGLTPGHASAATFETRLRWSPGSATGSIEKGLRKLGYRMVSKPGRFVVTGSQGPLREGEVERAREWGVELRTTVTTA
ncbi:MAG TPA: flavodoxin [Candidatus Binatia bacterium]|nr:flavodoxin [Candidatus Binatia bacterium]